MDDKRRPGLLVAVIALLGAYSLPHLTNFQQGPPSSQSRDKAEVSSPAFPAVGDFPVNKDIRALQPLVNYLSARAASAPVDEKALKDLLKKKLPSQENVTEDSKSSQATAANVHCLIISLPNPVASAVSARFDEYLDVLQRAIELQGFILDGAVLPWKPVAQTAAKSDQSTRISGSIAGLDLQIDSSSASRAKEYQPGLLVFKDAFPPTATPSAAPAVVLAFLIPESPVEGIEKETLCRALDLIDKYFGEYLTVQDTKVRDGNARKIIHVIAPCFSGSQSSLEQAITVWCDAGLSKACHQYHFRVITSHASQIEESRLGRILAKNTTHEISFSSMVHKSTTLRRAMLSYLKDVLRYDRKQVAILVESNTGLSQALVQHQQDGQPSNEAEEFIFPLQLTEMRKAYQRADLVRADKADAKGSAQRLVIPSDEAGTPLDLPRSYTPSTTAAIDEMSLTQVLTTISHRRFNAVGVIATNPLDMVFLARQVRKFCPNVRLFTIQGDLLLARPQEVNDLRGMLVASTYSLYPTNQWISTAYVSVNDEIHPSPRMFFSDQGSQGLYNATVAHLWEMGVIKTSMGPPLLEFGKPYVPQIGQMDKPPVWISAVGERGLFPVTYLETDANQALDDSQYLYSFANNAEGRGAKTSQESIAQARPDEQDAKRPTNAHVLYWLLCLLLVNCCFVMAIATVQYVRCRAGADQKERGKVFGYLGIIHLLRTLSLDVPDDDTAIVARKIGEVSTNDPDPPSTGSGCFLVLMNLLILGFCIYVFSSLLVIIGAQARHTGRSVFYWWLGIIPLSMSTASTLLAFTELVVIISTWILKQVSLSRLRESVPKSLWFRSADALGDQAASQRPDAIPPQLSPSIAESQQPEQKKRPSILVRWFLIEWIFLILTVATFWFWRWRLTREPVPTDFLNFERLANLPSGVSPFFSVFFLTLALGAWIWQALACRRLYRLSYLHEDTHDVKDQAPYRKILTVMRETRRRVNHLTVFPPASLKEAHSALRWLILAMIALVAIRTFTRGLPRSFEGNAFDVVFWSLFFFLGIIPIILHALQLLVLWEQTRKMLRLAVELPMIEAFDRIPSRFKRWFFGEQDFAIRQQLIVQQSHATKNRSTPELAKVYNDLFGPPTNPVQTPPDWNVEFQILQAKLTSQEGSLDSSRYVYEFLCPLWDSLPVEGKSRRTQAEDTDSFGSEVAGSWPLMAEHYTTAESNIELSKRSSKISPYEHAIVREWARAAEGLLALQIVRWFAPALSQFLPIMNYLVLASMALLLAVSSYPFDHQGWLVTVMVIVILFIVWVVGTVLIGVNRDELISRVSDSAPGQVSFDSNFVSSILTMIGPLFAALFAISFDMSDLLHTWLGPFLRLF